MRGYRRLSSTDLVCVEDVIAEALEPVELLVGHFCLLSYPDCLLRCQELRPLYLFPLDATLLVNFAKAIDSDSLVWEAPMEVLAALLLRKPRPRPQSILAHYEFYLVIGELFLFSIARP